MPAGEGELPTVEPVTVTIGENVDEFIVVTSGGLSAGDMVVTRGKEQLYPTAHIIPTNLKPPGGGGGGAPGGAPAGEKPAASGDEKSSDKSGIEEKGK